jgi:hypothetical protein
MSQNRRIEQILQTIKEQIATCIDNRADDIAKSWTESINESSESGENGTKVSLSFASSVDFGKNSVETSVTFSTKYKESVKSMLPDPDQLKMPI